MKKEKKIWQFGSKNMVFFMGHSLILSSNFSWHTNTPTQTEQTRGRTNRQSNRAGLQIDRRFQNQIHFTSTSLTHIQCPCFCHRPTGLSYVPACTQGPRACLTSHRSLQIPHAEMVTTSTKQPNKIESTYYPVIGTNPPR